MVFLCLISYVYANNVYFEDSDGTYIWSSSGCVGTNAFDKDWVTYAQEDNTPDFCYLYVNYTIPLSLENAKIEHKIQTEEQNADEGNAWVYCLNSGGTYTQLRYLDYGESAIRRNDTIDSDCLTGGQLKIRIDIKSEYSDGYARLYEEGIWWNISLTDTNYSIITNPQSNTGTVHYKGMLEFNATVTDSNGTAGINFDGVDYLATNVSDLFEVNFTYYGDGNYTYYWFSYGVGINNNYNQTENLNYEILSTDNGDIKRGWKVSILDKIVAYFRESGLFEFFGLLKLWNTAIPESCNSESSGGLYFDTDTNSSYLCDGTDWSQVLTEGSSVCLPNVNYGTIVLTSHAYSDTGNEYAQTLTSLSTNGAIFTCDDCVTFAGAESTCSTDTNSYLSCTMVVTCS